MEKLNKVLDKNRHEAISLLKKCEDYTYDFEGNMIPTILYEDFCGIRYCNVLAVKFVEDINELLLYLEEFDDWVNTMKIVESSMNNVYLSIEKSISIKDFE